MNKEIEAIKEAVDFEYDGHRVWAVIKRYGKIIARERIPREWLNPDMDKTKQEWYFTGIARRLRAKLKRIDLRTDDGKALN